MPVQMTDKDEIVWKYLISHKTPVTQDKIAKYFLISKSHAGRVLNYFVQHGIAEVIKIGSTKYYKVKE